MTTRVHGPGFAVRVSAFYAALFVAYGTMLPYLPVWLDFRGLSASEIGIVVAAPLALRLLVTPGIALLADRFENHRLIITALAVSAVLSVALMAHATGFWPILLCALVFQVAVQSIMPLIETVAMAGMKRQGHDYGRMRLWGSATFVAASFAGAGLIDQFGAGAIAWLLLSGLTVTFLAAVNLPAPRLGTVPGGKRSSLGDIARLAGTRNFVLFLIAAGAVQSAHAVFYGFGVVHWRSVGVSGIWIGTLWAVGIIAEIALFWMSATVLAHVTATGLIVIAAMAAVVRWTLMAFDPPLAVLLPLQVLHGLTYGACHLGAMYFIQARMPTPGIAQALYATVAAGIGMGGAMLLAGYSYGRFGSLSYLGMALLALIGLIAGLAIGREQPSSTP